MLSYSMFGTMLVQTSPENGGTPVLPMVMVAGKQWQRLNSEGDIVVGLIIYCN